MTASPTDPLEAILYQCAQAAPQPWYPRPFADAAGIARDSLDPYLDRLRLAGLIELTEWTAEHGQGYRLTTEGKRVLYSPRLLEQARNGTLPPPRPQPEEREPGSSGPPTSFERGETIREALLSRTKPTVTRALIALNVAVFLFGLVLAQQQHLPLGEVAAGGDLHIPYQTGALTVGSLAEGEW